MTVRVAKALLITAKIKRAAGIAVEISRIAERKGHCPWDRLAHKQQSMAGMDPHCDHAFDLIDLNRAVQLTTVQLGPPDVVSDLS